MATSLLQVVAAALLGDDPGQQVAHLGLAISAMPSKGPDRAQLAGLGPPGDRFGVHSKHGCHLGRREQGFRLRRSHDHCDPPHCLITTYATRKSSASTITTV